MIQLNVETVLVIFVVMWLFNLLSFIQPIAKDIVNALVILLLLIFKFVAGW